MNAIDELTSEDDLSNNSYERYGQDSRLKKEISNITPEYFSPLSKSKWRQ